MSDEEIKKLGAFGLITLCQAGLAAVVLWNEIMAIHNRVPGGNYPIEHQSSWPRVILYCTIAVIGLLVLWICHAWDSMPAQRLPVKTIFLLSATPLITGAIFIHYVEWAGWCCESPFAFFFGFPFSFLRGFSGGMFDRSIFEYAHYNLFQVLAKPGLVFSWEFLPYPFLLNFLFWSNIIFLLEIAVSALFVRKNHRPVETTVRQE